METTRNLPAFADFEPLPFGYFWSYPFQLAVPSTWVDLGMNHDEPQSSHMGVVSQKPSDPAFDDTRIASGRIVPVVPDHIQLRGATG